MTQLSAGIAHRVELDVGERPAPEGLRGAAEAQHLLDRLRHERPVAAQPGPQIRVVGKVVDERLDQVLRRLEAAGDELKQHVEEDVVGELLLADLVLLREDARDRVRLRIAAARLDQRDDDLPHPGADAGEAARAPRASSRRGCRG